MKILLVHNTYQYAGGEDRVVDAELKLLEEKDNDVRKVTVSNDSIKGIKEKIKTAVFLSFSKDGRELIKNHISAFGPDVVHVHNFFPLLTPSIFYACQDAGVPVVHTLHNYRLICPSALLMADGRIYEKSIRKSAYWAVPKKVYRNSYLGTLAVAHMVEHHKKRGTWRNKVDRFIALTQFSKTKFVEAGFPDQKIMVKPNFVADPKMGGSQSPITTRKGALFVGRLSAEKGLRTLIQAWENIDYPLKIAGTGPLARGLNCVPQHVQMLGQVDSETVRELMGRSAFLVMPSEWYEGFPMVLVEAFAHGLPVIASGLGSIAEIVDNKTNGLHFTVGDSKDLADKVRWLIRNPAVCRQMQNNARRSYLDKYTPERNYEQLLTIYQDARLTV